MSLPILGCLIVYFAMFVVLSVLFSILGQGKKAAEFAALAAIVPAVLAYVWLSA
jgi:hypothetical protein